MSSGIGLSLSDLVAFAFVGMCAIPDVARPALLCSYLGPSAAAARRASV
jgi:hypothetical protein